MLKVVTTALSSLVMGKKTEAEEQEFDEFGNPIEKEDPGAAFRQYVAYCTGEEKYEKRFDIWEDSGAALRKIYWLQTRQFKIDHGYDFKMDLSHVKEYYQPATDALLAICKAAGTRPFMVVDLLVQGADPNAMEPRTENRAIHYLCRRGCYYGVRYLVEAGADYFALNSGHRNALITACDTARTGNQVRLVRFLLGLPGYVYKLEVRDSGNNTAAINAIFHQNIWILRLLLRAGARVTDDHLLDPGQESAFHVSRWIYAASILSDVDQMPKSALADLDYEQSNCWYRWTSLKGHYTFPPLLLYQSLWKFGQELCYRMCMQKKIVEDREPKLAKPVTAVRAMADDLAVKREQRRMRSEIKAAKAAAKAKKLVNRELGNEVRELDDWNRIREALALQVDEEFSKHLRGKGDTSAVEWVRKQVSDQRKERIKEREEKAKAAGVGVGRNRSKSREGGGEELQPIEWETRLKVGSHYITPAPPLPKTKFSKIPLTKMLEQRHNRTHDAKHQINTSIPPEEFYLRASWVERDKPPDPLLPERLAPKYPTNKTPDGTRWKVMDRSELGLVDHEAKWAKLKMLSPIVVPPNSDSSSAGSDDDDSASDVSEISAGNPSGEAKSNPTRIR